MTRPPKIFHPLIMILLSITPLNYAKALAGEKEFFNSIAGQWQGPGKIVAGKYRGTRFSCNLKSASTLNIIGMDIEGFCRIGLFSQSVLAKIRKHGRHYSGKFINGKDEKKEHLNITDGRLVNSGFLVILEHEKFGAAMSAYLREDNEINLAIMVKVRRQLVPVINMSLKKQN